MKCHCLNCTNDAAEGSQFCTACQPPKKVPLTKLDEAKVRVAKAQDLVDQLYKEIIDGYGSINGVDRACAEERNKTTGKPNVLRRRYNNASKDLRIAKSDLERTRNEEDQRITTEKVKNRPCPDCDRTVDGPMCRACGPANDYREFVRKVSPDQKASDPWWKGGPLDTVNGMPWHVAVIKIPKGCSVILNPGKYAAQNGDRIREVVTKHNHRITEAKSPLDAVAYLDTAEELVTGKQSDDTPAPAEQPKKGVAKVMEENAQKAEAERARKSSTSVVFSEEGVSINGGAPLPPEVVSAAIDVVKDRRKTKQLDLNREEIKLPDGVTEDKIVSRKRVYEDGFYKVSINEEDLLDFNGKFIEEKRRIVGSKLRANPTKDDDFDPEDLPDEVDRMIKVLNIASLRLQNERLTQGMV